LFTSTSPISLPLVREKFSRLFTISDARKFAALFSRAIQIFADRPAIVSKASACRGNHGQRRVDFVSHTRRQQSDGGKFIGLGKLGFELDTLVMSSMITSRPMT